MNLEPSQGMTRYSVKIILETIFRRWFWSAVFAFLFAIGISAVYWSGYFSSVELSATFIPATPSSAAAAESVPGSYSVLMSQSYVGHEEVLDAVAKSVSFAVTAQELQQAISSEVSENGMSATVTVEWHNRDQAAELLSALKANLSYAVTHSAQAGVIKWLESDPRGATVPDVSRSRAAIVFIIAGLFGMLAGAGVAFLVGCFDKRVYDPTGVSYTGGDVRVIGMVGRRDDKEEEQPQQVAAIAMYLKKLAEVSGHKLVMCLSPGPRCGTSTVVRDVALVLAGMQLKILIVTVTDTGGFLPSASAVTPLAPGVDTCAVSWDDKESNPDFNGPLSSALAMGMKNYALVLVDCPPLLSHVQLSGLAAGMDTTLLVCGAGVTTRDEVGAAVSLLSRASDRPIYCVWNFVDRRFGYAYLPVEAEPEPARKVTDECKNIGADVRL
jgi:capsular polysaccharide biosynthesis protein